MWEGEIFFRSVWGGVKMHNHLGPIVANFSRGKKTVLCIASSPAVTCLSYWFTCVDLFMFAVRTSAAFSIIHRDVAKN